MPDAPTPDAPESAERDLAGDPLIWDLPLRLFHWVLVLAVAGSWLTHRLGMRAFVWHKWCGYTTLVLLFFRLVWGFAGPRHARFGSFVRGPAATLAYARSLFARSAADRPLAGHNPLGGLMVLVMLAMLATQGLAGLFANDELLSTGPLYGYVADETSDVFSRVHRQLSDWLWIVIGLHIAAIAAYWLLKRDNLLSPMISGRKHGVSPREAITGSRLWLALGVAGAGAALLYAIVATAPEPSVLLF